MKKICKFMLATLMLATTSITALAQEPKVGIQPLSAEAKQQLAGQKILYIERNQYNRDHHNTATIFQAGEINEKSFKDVAGTAMRVYDVDSGTIRTLVESKEGVVRDPELSFDGKKIIFSMRNNIKDGYHIYEIDIDGTNLKQLTFAEGISDIDPLYLPDGDIIFGSTRQPKYCMCNRHIMCNLFRMEADGANITQLGVSTLFEGHPSLLPDGRILYDRWEYVDRNFSNAQGLWTVNPDGTKHSIYYGNNTSAPDGVIDARIIPGTDKVVCIFANCHDRPCGALVVLDRKKGVDGEKPVVKIWPEMARSLIGSKPLNTDVFRALTVLYEDPYPINDKYFLVSRTIDDDLQRDVEVVKNGVKKKAKYMSTLITQNTPMSLYLVGMDGSQELILKGEKSLHDAMFIEPRPRPSVLPTMRNYSDTTGKFYVQDVYKGTHMMGVERGAVKYLRLVESMEKRTYTSQKWKGEGDQAPAMNWHNFDGKRIISEFEIEEDGSAYFEAPAGKFLYFQLLDKDKKMIQTMRSGISLMPGETNGCVGCHEDRLEVPMPTSKVAMALKKPAVKITGWGDKKQATVMGFMDVVQPILDKNCVSCHDFDEKNRNKLVLAGDKNPYFNAAYINLYISGTIDLIGGGPSQLQKPYAWGSHKSKLTKIIDSNHHGINLSDDEKIKLYAWMDLNGGYYPTYDSAFDITPAGRSPMTSRELSELYKLVGLNFKDQGTHMRKNMAQISFERPELSPCLDKVRGDKAKYDRAVELITIGAKRLQEQPRGDKEGDILLCDRHKKQLRRYADRMEGEGQNSCNIDITTKRYDSKPTTK